MTNIDIEDTQNLLSDAEIRILNLIKKRKIKTSKIIDRLGGLYSTDEILEALDRLKELGLIG